MNTIQQILALIETKNNWNTSLLKEEILKILAAREDEAKKIGEEFKSGLAERMFENYGDLPPSMKDHLSRFVPNPLNHTTPKTEGAIDWSGFP